MAPPPDLSDPTNGGLVGLLKALVQTPMLWPIYVIAFFAYEMDQVLRQQQILFSALLQRMDVMNTLLGELLRLAR